VRHLIGGFGLGFSIGLISIPASKHKFAQCAIIGLSVAMTVWGFFP